MASAFAGVAVVGKCWHNSHLPVLELAGSRLGTYLGLAGRSLLVPAALHIFGFSYSVLFVGEAAVVFSQCPS